MVVRVPEIGRLRDRVTLGAPVDPPALGADGEPAAQYTAAGEVWAAVETLSGREFLTADQLVAEVSDRVWIKWRPDVTRRWRLIDKRTGRKLFVEHAKEYRKEDRLELLCKAGK
jgi:SPP1 family predicted phage head-tail adaptor